ncbi:MAG: hypothetical protein CMP38_03870 [Rickettsiales bacterium]|nr:hypothetical protein [Rickettsiales bacterium]OUW02915.1 MAG: hypothetical protein CBD16_03765 [Betaproteobacteria bacterium TMED156]
MTEEKTFILGIGAPKAGTTWLYEYIQNDPKANFGQMKEYHYWNLAFLDQKESEKKYKLFKKSKKKYCSDELLRWTMLSMKNYYGIYFNSIINSGYSITGDITPHYARAKEHHLKYIKKYLEAFGFNIKVVYLLRDPMERLWSNVRMERELYESIKNDLNDSEAINFKINDPFWKFDSFYINPIKRIQKIFKKENIYIGIFEEMFLQEKLMELSNFIGVNYNPEMIQKKINVTNKKEKLDNSTMKEIQESYIETYEFCYKNFPQTKYLWNKQSE